MPYLLNRNKGSNFIHPKVGTIPPLTAIPITDKLAITLKGINGVIIFDEIMTDTETVKPGKAIKTYQDFVREYKDVKIAAVKYKEHKQKQGK